MRAVLRAGSQALRISRPFIVPRTTIIPASYRIITPRPFHTSSASFFVGPPHNAPPPHNPPPPRPPQDQGANYDDVDDEGEVPEVVGAEGKRTRMKDMVVELTAKNFERMTVQSQVPVVMMCYTRHKAECQTMRNKLEAIVRQYPGSLRLSCLNLETAPELAQQLGIMDVPAMFCFANGRLVDRFTGLVSDKTINERINILMRTASIAIISELTAAGEAALEAGDVKKAVETYNKLVTDRNMKAESYGLAGLAMCALNQKDLPLAQALVKNIKDNHAADITHIPLIKQAVSNVELAAASLPSTDMKGMEDAVQASPDDQQLRYDLATAYFASGHHEKAVHQALECLRRDRTWNEEAARKLVLKIFEALGPASEITKLGRRRFSSLWFM
eukprot:TRINITY_DN5207_c0_g1_i4.p1 TRINITY_DN5207_c0_g1~~TRINITY_DN5207_c0_g1_i4.p1  ORF type:complete len:401 (-),score=102.88 TRINITY_DN5207_c0_g1_i4:55-1218(-)